jgi:hypothetical protein
MFASFGATRLGGSISGSGRRSADAADVEVRVVRGDPQGLARGPVRAGDRGEVSVSRHTVSDALTSAWPRERKPLPRRASVLDSFKPVIDEILRADLDAPRKQRHTVKRIYDRLIDERGRQGVSYQVVRHRGLTEQAAEAAVDSACRLLRLPTIRSQFTDLAEAAARDQMTYRGFLAELLLAECDDRARRRSERRIKAAAFPRDKSLRTFDFDANPNVDPAVIHTLATREWVKKGLPLCLIGDSGTGSPTCSSRSEPKPRWPASESATCWPPSWSTSWSRPPTTATLIMYGRPAATSAPLAHQIHRLLG